MSTNTREVNKNRRRRRKRAPDLIFLCALLFILAFGIVMVFSASYYHGMTSQNNQYHFVSKQIKFAILGLVVMFFIIYFIDYRIFRNKMILILAYVGPLALAVLSLVMGVEKKGAQRWLVIAGINFQPSELVKIGVIIALSGFIASNQKRMKELKFQILSLIMVGMPAALISLENLSSGIVIFFVGMVIIAISSENNILMLLILIPIILVALYTYNLAMTTSPEDELGKLQSLFGILKQYRLNRIRVWKNPWIDPQVGGYQAIQSLYAIGSGGVFGLGLGRGIQKLGFIPEPHNDIIFAVICEELGLVGAAVLIIAFAVLVIRGLIIATRSPDLFGMLLVTGISSMIGVQVLINIAVNTNTMPTTGMQLPFISYGGTALLISLVSMGILLNVSRYSNIRKIDS